MFETQRYLLEAWESIEKLVQEVLHLSKYTNILARRVIALEKRVAALENPNP